MNQHPSVEEPGVIKYPRRTQKKRETRQRIISETVKLVANVDCCDLTMATVAEVADVHVTTLFTHFKTKQDLFTALSEPAIETLSASVEANQGSEPFFKFYRGLWNEVFEVLLANEGQAISDALLWRRQVELVLGWLAFEKKQFEMFAAYLEQDFSLTQRQGKLLSGMLVTTNMFAIDEWINMSGSTDIRATVLDNIAEVELMIEKSFQLPPPAQC